MGQQPAGMDEYELPTLQFNLIKTVFVSNCMEQQELFNSIVDIKM